MTKDIIIYMGFDKREELAYQVAESSIKRRCSEAQVIPLELKGLRHVLTRPIEQRDGKLWCPLSQAPMATEFAISRFCVPFLQREGWALFCDSDIVCLRDIKELFALADPKYAVQVVKHSYVPKEQTKMDGQAQTSYARKNWSSVILWNCGHSAHTRLTSEALNQWPGRDLHAFKWLADEEIGELPLEWNYLVAVSISCPNIGIAHFTLGGPWFPSWKGGPLDDVWLTEKAASGL